MGDATSSPTQMLVKAITEDYRIGSLPEDDIESRAVIAESRDASGIVSLEELDWSRPSLRGWTIARSNGHKASYVWQHGYRLEDPHGGEWWLCKTCHKGRKGLKHRYRTDQGVQQASTSKHKQLAWPPLCEQAFDVFLHNQASTSKRA